MAEAQIHGLMVSVMRLIGSVGKDNTNAHFKFKYRSIDDAVNAIGSACREVGVVTEFHTSDEKVLETNKGFVATCRATVRFIAPDGSSVESSGFGMGIDPGDKAANKAMSAGFKYAVFDGLVIPVEAGVLEDPDHYGDPEPARDGKPVSNRKQKGRPSPKEMEDMNLDDLRKLREDVIKNEGKESTIYAQIVEIGKAKAGK